MKKFSLVTLLAIGVALGSFAWADHHEGDHKHSNWFDAGACDICKPWSENSQLMMSTKWETHTTKSGMMMVAIAPEGQKDAFDATCKKMDANVKKIMAGAEPKGLCGFCQAMGGLMEAGSEMEKVKTSFGTVTLVTSGNPEAVKKIHAVAKRSQEEAKKMLAVLNK